LGIKILDKLPDAYETSINNLKKIFFEIIDARLKLKMMPYF